MELYTTIFANFIDIILYQVKMLMFYDVQPTNLTFINKKWDLCSKYL